jgi:Ca-activated chloride channel family protein
MMRSNTLTALLVCLCLLAVPDLHAQENRRRNQPQEDEEIVRVETNLVSIPVSVRDRKGRFITDLRREDFQIFENGARQEIAHFAPIEQPFSVLLLIDTSGSTQVRLKDIQDSAIAFVEQLRPNDRVLPISFNNELIALVPNLTSDREVLRTAIRNTYTGLQTNASLKKITVKDKTYTVLYAATRLYDAVHLASELLKPLPGRKAIILFTDGFDTGSLVATLKSTLREVEERDAVVYVVQYCNRCEIFDVMKAYSSTWYVNNYLEGLANRTAGRFYRAKDMTKIAQAFTSIAEELRRLYSLGYYPTASGDPGAVRQVEVKVNRRNLVVRERKTYTQKNGHR